MPRLARFALLLPLLPVLVVACSSDDDAESGQATNADGGGPATPVSPLGCPATPTEVAISPTAPFWSGLIVLQASVAGRFENLEVEMFHPSTSAWEDVGFSDRQQADGRYGVTVSPRPLEEEKDLDLKLRVRARLQGCSPTEWAESPTFRLGDPITGTTWVGEEMTRGINDQIGVSGSGHANPVVGRSWISRTAPFTHSIAFNADKSYVETIRYTIEVGTATDPYANCTFELAYTGTWELAFKGSATFVTVSQRKLTVPLAGATACTNPPLAELSANQPGFIGTLPPYSWSLNIDYSPLLRTPAGKPLLEGSTFFQSITDTFGPLADEQGAETSSLGGYIGYSISPQYAKQ